MATGDIKIKYGPVTSLTVTALNSLASSPTAGWQSDAVDNSSDLFEDVGVLVVVDMANTAPANSKQLFVYAYGAIDAASPVYTNPATGTQGTITLVDVTTTAQTLRLMGTMPYSTADEVIESAIFSVQTAFSGIMPAKWGVAIINHTGAAIAASGNSVKYIGQYRTVA